MLLLASTAHLGYECMDGRMDSERIVPSLRQTAITTVTYRALCSFVRSRFSSTNKRRFVDCDTNATKPHNGDTVPVRVAACMVELC